MKYFFALLFLFSARINTCLAQGFAGNALQIVHVGEQITPILTITIVDDSSTIYRMVHQSRIDALNSYSYLNKEDFKSLYAYALECSKKQKSESNNVKYGSFDIHFMNKEYLQVMTFQRKEASVFFKLLIEYAKNHNSSGVYTQIINKIDYDVFILKNKHK